MFLSLISYTIHLSYWYKPVCTGNTCCVLAREQKSSFLWQIISCSLIKPHLHGRLFCNAIRRFFMRENLSRRVVTYTRRDSLTAIAFGKNRRRVKPHLHGRLFCNAIRRFFMRENLSRRVVTHTRQDSLAAIAFGKNRCRVSNTCDLRCRLYFCATRCNNRSRP